MKWVCRLPAAAANRPGIGRAWVEVNKAVAHDSPSGAFERLGGPEQPGAKQPLRLRRLRPGGIDELYHVKVQHGIR